MVSLLTLRAETLSAQRPATDDQDPIGYLLALREDLGLDRNQIDRLKRINIALEERNRPSIQRLSEVRGYIRSLPPESACSPEGKGRAAEYINEVRMIVEEVQRNTRAAMKDVGGVLSEQQKRQLGGIIKGRNDNRLQSGGLGVNVASGLTTWQVARYAPDREW
ncbi:MAG: hypothetical protein LBG44_05795 [Gemmatimonadota bacterium]|nr:hypothetical protein [Gemmatimonadota bacterium]